jgi:hypothetical protein
MRYTFLAIIILGLTACEKNKLAEKVEVDPSGAASVKLGYFSQYIAANNVGVQAKFDNERVSNTFTSPTPYPGGGFNTGGNSFADYLAIEPGSKNLIISIPKVNSETDSVVRFNGPVNLTANVRQTIMLTDTGANTAATVLIDDITPPVTPGMAKAKFFNGMPGTTLDFYVRTSTGVIVSGAKNVPYKSVSNYFEFPAGGSVDTLDVVNAGATYPTTTPLARYVWAQTNIIPTRVYTILAAGYPTIPYTGSDNRRARVSVVLNR